MIRDHHQVSHRQLRRDPPCRIRDEELLCAKRVEYPDRKRRERSGMAFVHVESPAQCNDLTPAQGSDDHCTLVSGDRGLWKAGNVAEWNAHGIPNGVRETAQSGAEDDPDRRFLRRGAFANRRGSFDGRLCRVLGFQDSGPISCSILSDTSSISMSRSSQGRNALSKPLSAMPASSSTLRSRCSAAQTYSSVRVVPLMRRLSVLSVTLRPRSKYSRKGCAAYESATRVCTLLVRHTSSAIRRSLTY